MSVLVARIAECPEHGLHGERERCFECDQPVERPLYVRVPAPDCVAIIWQVLCGTVGLAISALQGEDIVGGIWYWSDPR